MNKSIVSKAGKKRSGIRNSTESDTASDQSVKLRSTFVIILECVASIHRYVADFTFQVYLQQFSSVPMLIANPKRSQFQLPSYTGMKIATVFLSVSFALTQIFPVLLFHKFIGKPENFGSDLLSLFL